MRRRACAHLEVERPQASLQVGQQRLHSKLLQEVPHRIGVRLAQTGAQTLQIAHPQSAATLSSK